ncbi:MFS transporter [Nocardia fluminea]|uniref:MFS transporter n=1 Tax=Nocardia fluminea TaxID=134984 RepID=UPI0033CDAF42
MTRTGPLDAAEPVSSEGAGQTRDVDGLPRAFSLLFATRGISLAANVIVTLQLTFYATDVVGLSAGLVGTLFLVAKIFDGVTDLLVGFFIDRTNTRWGRARPYELFIIPIWVLTVAAFSTPDMGTAAQAAYLFVMYVLIHSVCATFLHGSEVVYLKRALSGQVRFAKVLSRQSVFIIMASAVGGMILPQLMATWGTEPGGWTRLSLVYAVPMMVLGLVRFLFIKETHNAGTDQGQKLSLSEAIRAVAQNRFIFILGGLVLLANIVYTANHIVGAYYFKYIFGDVGLMSLVSIGGLVIPFVFLAFPMAVRKIGAMNFLRVGLVLAAVGFALILAFPQVLPIVIIGQILGAATISVTMLVGFFVIQCIVYGEWKTGKAVEGVVNSVQSFCTKVGSGLASLIVGAVLATVGYDGLAESQTPVAEQGIIALYSAGPLAMIAIMLLLTKFYTLDKRLAAIQKDLDDGTYADTSTLRI